MYNIKTFIVHINLHRKLLNEYCQLHATIIDVSRGNNYFKTQIILRVGKVGNECIAFVYHNVQCLLISSVSLCTATGVSQKGKIKIHIGM